MTDLSLNSSSPAPSPPPAQLLLGKTGRGLSGDSVMHWLALGSGIAIILMLVALLVILLTAAVPSMRQFGFGFLTGKQWQPYREVIKRGPDGKAMTDEDDNTIMEPAPLFGALPMIYGTVMSSAFALFVATPLSFGAALFLVRIAPRVLIAPCSFLIEFLAAIPSLAYGIWGLFVLAPFLRNHVENVLWHFLGHVWGFGWLFWNDAGQVHLTSGLDMLCASLILGIMIIPIITAISRDILRSVPPSQVEGAVALGATWWQCTKEMLKFSRSGLFGAVMLGLARAAGETMAVTMVIGNNPVISISPLSQGQTMSSLLATKFQEAEGLDRSALLEIALILLVMSLVFNVVARALVVGKNSRGAAAY